MTNVNTIYHGDCVAGLAKLKPGSIDLAFADPPFNIGYEYDEYDDRKGRDEYLKWSREWISGVHHALKPDGTFWLAIGDEYAAELKIASQDVGFHCRSWVIWYYTFGVNCKNKFSRSHAHLFHFVKDPATFTFNTEAIRIPSARQLVYADARANPAGRLPDDTWVLRPQDLAGSFSAEEDTWYFPRVAGTFKERAGFHGCQMPEQLLGRIIRSCSRENEIVLDPFSGSATTLVVAKKLGRRYVGFELSKEYAKHGLSRLDAVRCGDRLDGSPEPLISAPATSEGKSTSKARRNAASALKKALGSEEGELERSREIVERALVAAYRETHDGWSVDRVVADPDLNKVFGAACARQGITGHQRTWNRMLFNLRKRAELSSLPATKRTVVPSQDYDKYAFASEIALRKLIDQGHTSLDEILCDPDLAAQFDVCAARYAPGFTPLQYRWAALKLRKAAKDARVRGQILGEPSFTKRFSIDEAVVSKLPESPGVYRICRTRKPVCLFVGDALNLRERIAAQFAPNCIDAWNEFAKDFKDFTVSVFPVNLTLLDLIGYRYNAVKKLHPLLNAEALYSSP